jgi:transcriptional regulator with XRE-family HTH domain
MPGPASGTESFGALLRRYRLATGLSQEALAERAGLSGPAAVWRHVTLRAHEPARHAWDALQSRCPDPAAATDATGVQSKSRSIVHNPFVIVQTLVASACATKISWLLVFPAGRRTAAPRAVPAGNCSADCKSIAM